MPEQNQSTITFKAEETLVDALRAMPNRSAFIRSAILAALDSTCPVCQGTGMLTPEQKRHWDAFSEDHSLAECDDCHEWHVICRHDVKITPHRRTPAKTAKRKGGGR
jgi:hypothetical protein